MYDAALFYGSKADAHSKILIEHGLERGRFVMATVHRQENTYDTDRLRSIFQALQAVAKEMPVVLPLHPRTRKHLDRLGAALADRGIDVAATSGVFGHGHAGAQCCCDRHRLRRRAERGIFPRRALRDPAR